MSELKAFIVLYDGKFIRAYKESESDKVIEELKQKINELQTELELWRDGSIISEVHQKELDEKRHSDYKRCLAMAKWCNDRYILDDCLYELGKTGFYERWEKRWLELAEKFKPNKEAK